MASCFAAYVEINYTSVLSILAIRSTVTHTTDTVYKSQLPAFIPRKLHSRVDSRGGPCYMECPCSVVDNSSVNVSCLFSAMQKSGCQFVSDFAACNAGL
jgi:hypothetical protein